MKLFSPAWNSENEKTALRAVEKITGQKKLAQVAKEAKNSNVRAAAVRKLGDADWLLLGDIAKNDSYAGVRAAAVGKLGGAYRYLLADIAKNDSDKDVREVAVGKLTDADRL
ncbi:MAG: hypothetical protein LBQ01_01860, partial [Prevotellaceae bacterium]|nr:hypothetical protein [Prevotellaceae bacterium]